MFGGIVPVLAGGIGADGSSTPNTRSGSRALKIKTPDFVRRFFYNIVFFCCNVIFFLVERGYDVSEK